MKTKNKIVTLVEIAIVLCSVFLVALPATGIAADQTTQEVSASEVTTTASEDDFVSDVYGNANEDDTIDMRDLTYVKLIFFGKKPETELADAKYDGKINPLDFIQIKLIIVGKEKELTLIDDYERIVTVEKPVKRVVLWDKYCVGAIQMFGVQDKIVGVSSGITKYTYLPELSKLPDIGHRPLDIEGILKLNPDLVVGYPKYFESLPESIDVLGFQFYKAYRVVEDTKKLGYIFGKKDEASYYIDDFHDKYIDTIKERTEGLSDEERPKVYVECNKPYKTYGYTTGAQQSIELAGGKNIFADVEGIPTVDPEEIIVRNPDIIIRGAYTDSGYGVDDPSKIKELRDEIMCRPGWDHINAVKNGRVYIVDVDLHYGLDYPIGIAYWVKCIHPDLFEDLDPQAIHQEYLTEFLGIDYDLDKHGVFVYPPLED